MNSKAVKSNFCCSNGVFIFCQTAGFAEAAVLKSEVPDKYKWNLADLIKDSQALRPISAESKMNIYPK